jgi:anti-sigma regulatory factor (Ser/Thr protein kinase)
MAMAASEDHSIELPAERLSIKRARDFVARAVADHVDDPAEILLMTSELVANVVGHVGSAVTITVRNGPVVRVEVHNHEAATEAFRDVLHYSPPPANSSPTGRGLGIVRSFASRVGLDDDPGRGKVVWFEWEHPTSDGAGDAALEAGGEPVGTP